MQKYNDKNAYSGVFLHKIRILTNECGVLIEPAYHGLVSHDPVSSSCG